MSLSKAKEITFVGFVDCGFQNVYLSLELASYVYVGCVGLHGSACQETSFDELVRLLS